MDEKMKTERIEKIVSVPYRGATFLNRRMADGTCDGSLFPSPIGELHFSIKQMLMDTFMKGVSVPYRGAAFLNRL